MSEQNDKGTKLKLLLGDMGIEILLAIEKGATKKDTIRLISGVPIECINGRIPVLLDLNLVINTSTGYYITHRGLEFLKELS